MKRAKPYPQRLYMLRWVAQRGAFALARRSMVVQTRTAVKKNALLAQVAEGAREVNVVTYERVR